MDTICPLGLVDSEGQPLPTHIASALARVMPRLRRQFPMLQDDLALTDVMEEAGRRIAVRECRSGRVERIHGYAWVTVRSVAISYMRRGSIRLLQKTLESEASRDYIGAIQAEHGSAEQIEREILLREVLGALSAEERLVCVWKKAGFSSQEIAHFQGRTVVSVDTLFSRAKQKVRKALGMSDSLSPGGQQLRAPTRKAHERHPFAKEATDTRDGRIRSAAER